MANNPVNNIVDSKINNTIWKNNIFVRVYLSTFISNLGDRLVVFILPLWVMSITKSSFLVSILNAVLLLTTVLLTPFTGTMADRFPRRILMIYADILRFFVMFTLVIIIDYNFSFYLLLFLLILRSIGTSLSAPAANAAIVTFVKKNHLEEAVALRQTMIQIVTIGAPLLGGALVGIINYKGIFIIDTLTFLISIIILCSLKFPKDIAIKNKRNFFDDMKDGINLLFNNNLLKVLLISAAIINVLGSSLFLCLQVFVVRDMNLSNYWWGIVFSSSPIGVIIGSFFSRKIKINREILSSSFIFIFIVGFFNILMGLTLNPWLFSLLYFCSGFAFGVSNVYFGVLYRKIIPNDKQGRFFGLLNSILLISAPIGITLTGLILETLKSSILIIIIGAITSLTSILTYIFIRKKEKLEIKFND
ncbi:MFS transporter [Bacillus wiedmannii]|uniref:MFS transporter n=1 Tax=Bacillus wiedmannii TaxID=1890302 RepID=UPI000BF683D5|nr:MFS transporter [Bacillus wiedmannii]PEP13992.1 MFS transporter [Bacillus wiedmannii]